MSGEQCSHVSANREDKKYTEVLSTEVVNGD